MGQKVNPHGLRVGVIKDWDSRWYADSKKFSDYLVSDDKLRKYLKKKLYSAGVSKIEIERNAQVVKVIINCNKPGVVIGAKGVEIEKLRKEVEAIVGPGFTAKIDVVEIKMPDVDAQLVAESVAAQIEGRVAFRRAMKQSIIRTIRLGAKGIKITCGGRLNGAEIARSETYHEGTIPLQTIRADIDYGFAEANTTYGKIGVKCWIYKGEILADKKKSGSGDHRDNDNRRGRDRRNNNDRRNNQNRGDRKFNGNRGDNNKGPRRNTEYRAPRKPREGGDKDVNA